MKAKELIEILSKGPLDADVIISHSGDGASNWHIGGVFPCFYGDNGHGSNMVQYASSEKPINAIAILDTPPYEDY